jgi:metal-responsive CopG/Arc/MetJ family transcriptional regulator
MPSKQKGFRGTSLKSELVSDIEKFIQQHPEAGYKSISDFVQEAVRTHIREIKNKYVARP